MSLLITLTILVISVFGICSIILLIEQSYDRLVERREITMRHFQWLWNRGLLETANMVDPRYASWRDVE